MALGTCLPSFTLVSPVFFIHTPMTNRGVVIQDAETRLDQIPSDACRQIAYGEECIQCP